MSQLEFGLRVVMPATLMPLHGAVVSDDGLYRYILTRTWDRSLPALVFCMLNPSTADATVDDPTIRKCIGFAQRLGYGGIIVVNLFAYRATKPRELYAQLAAGSTLGDAAREARVAVGRDLGTGALGWAVPVVFARDPREPLR